MQYVVYPMCRLCFLLQLSFEVFDGWVSHKPHLKEQPDREIRLLILRGLEAVFLEPFLDGSKSAVELVCKALLVAEIGEILADRAEQGVLLFPVPAPAVFAVGGGLAGDPADEDEVGGPEEPGDDGSDHAVCSRTGRTCSR